MGYFGIPFRNGVPIGLGSIAGFGAPQEFSPSELFPSGTAGAWYDPSDLTTMFTTSAGTTPVAMPGQGSAVSVGLMLDKSQNGVGTNGAKRLNLLTYSEQFDNAAWGPSQASVTPNTVTAPNGTLTADTLSWTASGSTLIQNVTVTSGVNYTFSVYMRVASGSRQVNIGNINSGAWSSVTVTTDWQLFTVTQTASAATRFPGFQSGVPGGGSDVFIWGADLRLASEANTLPLYQPITSSWYATLPGNHAIAINDSTARPELRARVNLLTYSEEFNQSVWGKREVTVTANTSIAPNGTTTADTLTETTVNNYHSIYFTNTVIAGQLVTGSFVVKKGSVRYAQINYGGTAAGRWIQCVVDLDTGLITQSSAGAGGTLVSSSSTSLGDGWYRVSLTGSVVTDTTTYFYVGTVSSATPSFNTFGFEERVGSTSNNVLIWGADLRPANIGAAVPAYQRIADANTYDTAGFPLYLRFDGIDDGMYTPANLNLSATDKVGVFAGVRKLSDAATGILSELTSASFSTNGGFVIGAPDTSATYSFGSRGTVFQLAVSASSYAAPISNVLACVGNIAGDSAILRANSIQAANNAGDQGSGNYANAPLYIGSRANSSLWLNGQVYGLVIVGSAVSAGNISATESWMAGKTGLVLP